MPRMHPPSARALIHGFKDLTIYKYASTPVLAFPRVPAVHAVRCNAECTGPTRSLSPTTRRARFVSMRACLLYRRAYACERALRRPTGSVLFADAVLGQQCWKSATHIFRDMLYDLCLLAKLLPIMLGGPRGEWGPSVPPAVQYAVI